MGGGRRGGKEAKVIDEPLLGYVDFNGFIMYFMLILYWITMGYADFLMCICIQLYFLNLLVVKISFNFFPANLRNQCSSQ